MLFSTHPIPVIANICDQASLEIHWCASPVVVLWHGALAPFPSHVRHDRFCCVAPSCAVMDLLELAKTSSRWWDENCSSATSSLVSHSDYDCMEQEPLFGLIELGRFKKKKKKCLNNCCLLFLCLWENQSCTRQRNSPVSHPLSSVLWLENYRVWIQTFWIAIMIFFYHLNFILGNKWMF